MSSKRRASRSNFLKHHHESAAESEPSGILYSLPACMPKAAPCGFPRITTCYLNTLTNSKSIRYLTLRCKNKFIYLSGYKGGSKSTYNDFNTKLQDEDPELLALFPTLKDSEKGKTCDDLFFAAVVPVVDDFS